MASGAQVLSSAHLGSQLSHSAHRGILAGTIWNGLNDWLHNPALEPHVSTKYDTSFVLLIVVSSCISKEPT